MTNGTKVKHCQEGYEGLIDGRTEICQGPKRNPDGKSQYRIRVQNQEKRKLACEEDLIIQRKPPIGNKRYYVYVVELEGVPGGTGRDVYIGMSQHTPEKRFENHKKGHLAHYLVKKYGKELVPELFEKYNPLTLKEARKMKNVTLRQELRTMGYNVYGGD